MHTSNLKRKAKEEEKEKSTPYKTERFHMCFLDKCCRNSEEGQATGRSKLNFKLEISFIFNDHMANNDLSEVLFYRHLFTKTMCQVLRFRQGRQHWSSLAGVQDLGDATQEGIHFELILFSSFVTDLVHEQQHTYGYGLTSVSKTMSLMAGASKEISRCKHPALTVTLQLRFAKFLWTWWHKNLNFSGFGTTGCREGTCTHSFLMLILLESVWKT